MHLLLQQLPGHVLWYHCWLHVIGMLLAPHLVVLLVSIPGPVWVPALEVVQGPDCFNSWCRGSY